MAKSADAFRTISEVAEWLDTPAHVLRFWESRFNQIKPVKRAGGRRYYRPNDMLLLGGIKKLLHEDGMTIKGAQKLLSTDGIKKISALSQPLDREDQDAIDLEPVENTNATTPALSIVASDEAETAPETEPAPAPVAPLDIEPVATPDPEPEIAIEPEPADAPDPEPMPDPIPDVVIPDAPLAATSVVPDPVLDPVLDPVVEPDPVPKPENTYTAEPAQEHVPAPEAAPISEPAPMVETELEPVLPEVAASPSISIEETIKPDGAPELSAADTPRTDDVGEQLSSIYSRLTALHDRMKTNIDPKRQG